MNRETKLITVAELSLGEKQVVFPGEFVRLKGVVKSPALSSLPSPSTTDKAILTSFGGLTPKEKIIFVSPLLDNRQTDIGTLCKVYTRNTPADADHVLKGVCRARIKSRLSEHQVAIELIDEAASEVSNEMIRKLHNTLLQLVRTVDGRESQMYRALKLTDIVMAPNQIIDLVCSSFAFNINTRFRLFNEIDTVERYHVLMRCLSMLVASVKSKSPEGVEGTRPAGISHAPSVPQTASPRDAFETSDEDDDLATLRSKLVESKSYIPGEGQRIVGRELKRLGRMNNQSTEYNVVRNYLETLADIPWSNNKPAVLSRESIKDTQACLDRDNYGLQLPKKRLVEYIAISYLRQLTQHDSAAGASPILLLVGPPGVGKTSLAKSVAAAMNKKLYRISLGGVRDEAEIRGHRRTYIGAMPGVIVQALRKAGTMNPVLVLDEIDKIAHGVNSAHGDPAAALLEVLDPAQNNAFKDHYVDFPIDLSQVTFIATANSLESIPRPLLDRMEVIHIEGYTYQEKLQIAQQFLVPKQLDACGLSASLLGFGDDAIVDIISKYTRESGVRELERRIGAACRGWAVENLDKIGAGDLQNDYRKLHSEDIKRYLGAEIYSDDVVNDEADKILVDGRIQHRHPAGVVNGLAYMGSGMGGILVLEATQIPHGSGKLKLTGKLGDVMTESANIALSWVRANSGLLGISPDKLSDWDFHLHAPAGAVPKDGPSAGIAMTVCLVSLLTGKPVPRDLAMSGEMTLRGKVLPVGGVREKLLGAHTAGVHQIILPFKCEETVAEEIKKGVKFPDLDLFYAKYIWDVLALVWPEDSLALAGQRSLL